MTLYECDRRVDMTDAATITISLLIENLYERYDTVTTTVTDGVVKAPANTDEDDDAYRQWQWDEIYDFTGVGHADGDSWYNVTVTACSDPTLVGREFEFGY